MTSPDEMQPEGTRADEEAIAGDRTGPPELVGTRPKPYLLIVAIIAVGICVMIAGIALTRFAPAKKPQAAYVIRNDALLGLRDKAVDIGSGLITAIYADPPASGASGSMPSAWGREDLKIPKVDYGQKGR